VNEAINDIDILIGKAVSGNASPEEMAQLESWLSESESNMQVWQEAVKVWEKSRMPISERELQSDRQKVNAAVSKDLQKQVRLLQRRTVLYRIAAILTFPLALGISFYFLNTTKKPVQDTPQICEIISPKGHITKCILPDGTEIWVNTGSSISYNTVAFNNGQREVILKGEAYFEVASDAGRPFTVVTPHADVKVTGTSFNVNAYPGNLLFETVLEEGSVELLLKGKAVNTLSLVPGDRVSYEPSTGKYNRETVEARLFTAWRNGEVLFRDATLNDLIKELERIYDIRFRLADKSLGEFRFRGMFSYNNNLIDALEKIKRTSGIGYYIENKEVTLVKK
jgi:transmembrane sensor